MRALDKELIPDDVDDANKKKAKAEKDKASQDWKTEYKKKANQFAEYSKTATSAVSSVLDESTKFTDSQTGKYKEELAAVN